MNVRASVGVTGFVSSPVSNSGSVARMTRAFPPTANLIFLVQLDTRALAKFRERVAEFYGSDAPNKNGGLRRALAGDYSGIQQRVNDLTVQFHNEIKRDRPLRGDADKIKDTLSGKMFDVSWIS